MIVASLPLGSATSGALHEGGDRWGTTDYLTAQVIDLLASMRWMWTDGKEPHPEPFERPGPEADPLPEVDPRVAAAAAALEASHGAMTLEGGERVRGTL